MSTEGFRKVTIVKPTDQEIMDDRSGKYSHEDFKAAFARKYAVQIAKGNEARDAYFKAFEAGTLTVDACGHYDDDPDLIKKQVSGKGSFNDGYEFQQLFDDHNFQSNLRVEGIEKLIKMLANPAKGTNYDDYTNRDTLWAMLGSGKECPQCGQWLNWYTNGKIMRLLTMEKNGGLHVDKACPFSVKETLPEIKAIISVPSGKLVFANDLRHIFDEKLVWGEDRFKSQYSINHFSGQIKYVERYAQHGMLTGFTGNTSVHVCRSGKKDSIVIGRPAEERDGKADYMVHHGVKHPSKGHICCDLWWYGAADYDLCVKLNKKALDKSLKLGKKPFVGLNETFVLDVKPGRWEMTHRHHLITDEEELDEKRDTVFSVLKWLGPC